MGRRGKLTSVCVSIKKYCDFDKGLQLTAAPPHHRLQSEQCSVRACVRAGGCVRAYVCARARAR